MKYINQLRNHPITEFFVQKKYYILIISFVVYLLFFDRYNLINQWKLSATINEMEEEIEYYEQEIQKTKELREKINSDLEKFARERYLMHREDEDIFVFNRGEK